MLAKFLDRLEKTLVGVIVAVCVLPVALGGMFHFWGTDVPAISWLRNATISFDTFVPKTVPAGVGTVFSGAYQDAVSTNYNYQFAGRELMIRLINELYFRVLHSAGGTLVGPQNGLIQVEYAQEYCLDREGDKKLRELVTSLRRMQDFCAARGMGFDLLLTPSKPSLYPEMLPARWLARYRSGPRYYDQLVPLLKAAGIRYVDGHEIVMGMKESAKIPLFPLGGIHWGDPASLAVGNALLESLASQGLHVEPIRDYQTTISNDPEGQDYDQANVMNIASRLHYPVAQISVQPMFEQHRDRPNIAFVGGSFAWSLLNQYTASMQFSEMDYYFYYRENKRSGSGGAVHILSSPTAPVNFATDIYAADALVVELNDFYLKTGGSDLQDFFGDAFPVLPDPRSPKAPFHYETRQDYRWGEKLSLVAGAQPINRAAFGHFTESGPDGPYTLGPLASIRLHTSPPAGDVILELVANAFLAGTRLPEQDVNVVVNGRQVADWTWREGTDALHRAVIPREVLVGDETEILLRIAHPTSPAELNGSIDTSKYGIIISSLQLSAAPHIDCRFDDTLTLAAGGQPFDAASLEGFTPRTKEGVYTLGADATMHLGIPVTENDVALEVDAEAFLVDKRLPEQRVGVVVNGHPVGEWVWRADTPRLHKLVIPRAILDEGRLAVEFHVARPGSPAEFGLSEDRNQYGIIIRSLRLLEDKSWVLCHWGETLSLATGGVPVDPAAVSGFTPETPDGLYTQGSVATMRLHTPPANKDVVLEVNANAFLVDKRLPEQRVQVLANGQPVGEWIWRSTTPPLHRLTLPAALLGDGNLVLEFRIARPGSPAEFGLSKDTNKFGITIQDLRLYPATP